MVQVSLSAPTRSNALNRFIDNEDNITSLRFNLDESPPASGYIIGLNSSNLSEFDVNQIQITDGRTDTSVNPDNRFEIGSVTKIVTATTLLKLIETGTLAHAARRTDRLLGSVTNNLPNISNITLRLLLNRTSDT